MNKQYKCETSIANIADYISKSSVVGFDYETAPDDAYREDKTAALDAHKSHIVGCSFSNSDNSGIYVPIMHKSGKNVEYAPFMILLEKFLTNKDIIKVGHNLSFESQFSYANGIVITGPTYDTIAAAQLTLNGDYEFRKLGESGLKRLTKELLNDEVTTFGEVTDGKFFDELNAQDENTVAYGAADSDNARKLYFLFNKWFDKFLPHHKDIVDIESQVAVYLGIMKYNGIPVDDLLMKQKKEIAESEMERLRNDIKFMIGDIDIGENASTMAFKNYLYKDLKLPVLKTTEKSKEAADDMTMILLKEWCDKNRPELSKLFIMVQEYRKWGKIKSTYIDGYLKAMNVATGRIHPDMFALSTDTGRLNCKNPNCQNMPRKGNDPIGVRNFIKAPDGYQILSLDYSQIELRVLAFYSQDKNMLETYNKNGDIHAMTTSVIYNISYSEAVNKDLKDYKERRSIAKNTNFGMAYSIFSKGLQKTLKFKAGIEKSVEECQTILDNLKAGYPEMIKWQNRAKVDAYNSTYSETWLGRRRYLRHIRSTDWGLKSFAERCALNTPIQGTAADILKLAMGRIIDGLKDNMWLKPILQIHDELVFLVPNEKLTEAVAYIKSCMEVKPFPEFNVPLIAESSHGSTFGTMEED